MIDLLIFEAIFFISLFTIIFLLYVKHNHHTYKIMSLRMKVFFELNKVFYRFKNIQDIVETSLRMIVDSLPTFSSGGMVIYDNDKISIVKYYDITKGFSDVSVSEGFRKKIQGSKFYFSIDEESRRLNNFVLHTLADPYEYLHVIKFYLDNGSYGAFFFGGSTPKIKTREYEFMRIIVDYFSFGFRSRHLSSKLTQFSKTIDALENTYQRIVDNLPVGVVGIDNSESNKVILWNDLMKKMFGLSEQEIVGKSVTNIFHQQLNKQKIDSLIDTTLKTKHIQEISALTHLSPNGDKKHFLVLCYLLRDSDTNFRGAILVFRDITDKTILQKKLLKAQKVKEQELQQKVTAATKELQDANLELKKLNNLKSEFVSIVSHELRTPLTSIRGYASLLLSNRLGDLSSQQNESIAVIKEEGERLSQLIEDLLDLSKLESGKTSLRLDSVILKDAAHEVVNSLKVQFEPKDLDVVVRGKNGVKISADVPKLKQILYNLISNSIKFTPDGGKISITISENPDYGVFSVKDTGIGISKRDLKKIFEPFSQAQGHLKRSVKGTGLGLTISKHIVELHHGKLDVTSSLKKGSTFKVSIPKTLYALNGKEK